MDNVCMYFIIAKLFLFSLLLFTCLEDFLDIVNHMWTRPIQKSKKVSETLASDSTELSKILI